MKRKRATVKKAKQAILKEADRLQAAGINVSRKYLVIGGERPTTVEAEQKRGARELMKLCPFCAQPPKPRPDYQTPHVNCKNIGCPIFEVAMTPNSWETRDGIQPSVPELSAVLLEVLKELEAMRTVGRLQQAVQSEGSL